MTRLQPQFNPTQRSRLPFKGIGILALFCVLLCLNCDYNSQSYDFQEVQSSVSRNQAPEVKNQDKQELIVGNTRFGIGLYQRLASSSRNIIFSPHSISIALAMTYGGARGNTELQMAGALHFTLAQDRLHAGFNYLDLELGKRNRNAEKDEFQLSICNAAWGQKGYQFLDTYLDLLALNYGAGMKLLDFERELEKSRQTINDWVEEQTNGTIKELIKQGDLDQTAVLVLTNAIYFKAGWLIPFDPENTRRAPFHNLSGEDKDAYLMRLTDEFSYTELEGEYQAVELLYKGEEVSMVVILPQAGQFDEFERQLTQQKLDNILNGLQPNQVSLTLPRFSFEFEESLKKHLKNLGMTDAFDQTGLADFSGIDGTRLLYIFNVLHKAFISVDEYGTEASAATAVVIAKSSLPKEMLINRPFIFLIRDKVTGAILFLGRVIQL